MGKGAGKGRGKKKGKKDKVQVIPGGLTAEEEKDRQLKAKKAFEYFKETKVEEKKFDTYRQEREQLNYFWIVEKKRLEDKKAELRCARGVLRCFHFIHTTRGHLTSMRVVSFSSLRPIRCSAQVPQRPALDVALPPRLRHRPHEL